MKKNISALSLLAVSVCFLPDIASAASSHSVTSTQTFSVRLGASRLIYDPASNGTTLTVTNPQDYPILIQSQALDENRKNKAPFVVTPPLMRLDGQQSSRLRIVRTGGNFRADRETLQWLCVKGIPPKAGDEWAKEEADKVSLNVQLTINNCIKLLIRPGTLKSHPDDAENRLQWQQHGNKLTATNNSPFYINISALKINGVTVQDIKYVAPFSSRDFTLPSATRSKRIEWKIVNDYGGESQTWQANVE